jgi:hypothetical protein
MPQRFVFRSQMSGDRQSESALQAELHEVVPLHRNGAQARVVAGLHVPAPSHIRVLVCVEVPAGQVAEAHVVPAA